MIYNELSTQLNVDEEKMGELYTYFSISGAIFCLIAAWFVEKYEKIHWVMSLFCLTGSIVISLIYFVNNFAIMVILWILMAAVQYFLETVIIVLVFRAFNINGSILVAFYYFIGNISSSTVGLIFELFNSNGNYSYGMYIFSLLGIISCILLCILSSPTKEELIKDIEQIQRKITQEQQDHNNNLDIIQEIEHYKKTHVITKSMAEFTNSPYMTAQASRNSAVINELNDALKKAANDTHHINDTVLYNLFQPISNTIQPYHIHTYHHNNADELSEIENNPMNEAYWFDFEQNMKHKENVNDHGGDVTESELEDNLGTDLRTNRKNVTYLFAIIAVFHVLIRMIQTVCWNAYIILVVAEVFYFNESMGYYLITTYWIGAVIGRVTTVVIIKMFKPDNVMIFFASWLLLNSILYLIVLLTSNNNNGSIIQILLYIIAFQGGFAATPLHSANLAFLSNIQPITGLLSALIMMAESIARGASALIVAFFVEEIGINTQIYVHLTTSILVFTLMATNKIRYMFLYRNK